MERLVNKIEPINHHTVAIRVLQDHFEDKEITGIEIGTADGLLTKSILLFIPTVKMIYAIDPYLYIEGTEFEASLFNQAWHDDRYNQAARSLAEYPGRYTHLRMGSDQAVSVTPDQVDFVWVDGDHTAGQVIKDILNYYPKVKPGCIFGGHDSNLVLHHLRPLVTEEILEGVDLTWWLVKK